MPFTPTGVLTRRVRSSQVPVAAGLPAFLGRPRARSGRVALVTVNMAAAAFFVLSYSSHGVGFGPYRIDLDVYRIGGWVWLHGGDLYGHLPPTMTGKRLPFTYPPTAAVLLSPLSLVPMTVAVTIVALGTIALAGLVLRLFLNSLTGLSPRPWWTIAWLLPPALFLEPVRNTLLYGQINVALMALVSLDCLPGSPHRVPGSAHVASGTVRWPRGMLVGLAAAVKLTPAAFVLFFLLRRDYRAVAAAAASFLAVTGTGFLLDWHDSTRYWTGTVFQIGRIGGPVDVSNQSIQGVLARAGLDPRTGAGTVVWLALSAVVLAVAVWGMRRAFAASQAVLALSLNAFAVLLISPISWSHHWVWCVPALLALVVLGHRHHIRLATMAALCGLAVFAAAPQWWFTPGWGRPVWQQVAISSYVIFAALILLLSACGRLIPAQPPGQREAEPVIAAGC